MGHNLGLLVGPLSCHWIPTHTPCTASFDLQFPIRSATSLPPHPNALLPNHLCRLYIPITIRNTSIFISSAHIVHTPIQLVQYILDKISNHILNQIHTQAQALLPRDLDKMYRQTSTFVLEFPPVKMYVQTTQNPTNQLLHLISSHLIVLPCLSNHGNIQ